MNPTSVEAGAEVAKSAMETVIAAMSVWHRRYRDH